MEQGGIIQKVDYPTDWIHPIVVVPKKQGVRICVDLTKLNKWVKRFTQPFPHGADANFASSPKKVFSCASKCTECNMSDPGPPGGPPRPPSTAFPKAGGSHSAKPMSEGKLSRTGVPHAVQTTSSSTPSAPTAPVGSPAEASKLCAAPAANSDSAAASSAGKDDVKDGKNSGRHSGRRMQSAEYEREKELRRKAYTAANEKVRLVLWPTQEAYSNVKKALGGEINWAKLASSVRWQDAWVTFNKRAIPSGKDREDLRRLALEILTPAKPKTKRGNNAGTPSQKRAREPSVSPAIKPSGSYVIPKKSKTGDPPAGEKISPEQESGVTEEDLEDEDMEKGIVEDKSQEPGLNSFTEDMGDALSTGYAAAAKRRPRQECPHILFIHKGKEMREKVTREEWKLLLAKLNEQLFDMAVEGKEVPRVEWSGHSKGTGLIAPVDEAAQHALIELVGAVTVAEHVFKAWPKGTKERENFTLVTIKVPASLANVSVDKLVKGLPVMNGFDAAGWRVFEATGVRGNKKERLLRLIVSVELLDTLREKDGYLYAGTGRVEVHYKKVRLSR